MNRDFLKRNHLKLHLQRQAARAKDREEAQKILARLRQIERAEAEEKKAR